MILFPPAKINIGLNIIQKRTDGYHDLETIMIPIPLYDILEIKENDTFVWQQSGIAIDSKLENNLCYKAYQLIKKNYNIPPIYMHLHKHIPMGAGLGGGSADAAYVIRGLNTLFQLDIPLDNQRKIAEQLGSDCPLFLEDEAKLATGKGEILQQTALDLSGKFLLLVKPEIHINTAEAYGGVHISGENGKLIDQISQPITTWKGSIKNDFEVHLFERYPELALIKNQLYELGATYASMSGSGSTIYGIFEGLPPIFSSLNCKVYSLKL